MTLAFFDSTSAAIRKDSFQSDPRPFLTQIEDQSPSVLSGSLYGPVQGVKHGWDAAASAMANTVGPWMEDTVRSVISEDAGLWMERQRRIADESLRETRADPRSLGIVGQLGHALGSVLTQGAMGGVVAGPVGAAASIGGLSGFDKYKELIDQGVDKDTALKVSGITGSVMGVGALLPPFIGSAITTQVLSGVGLNVTLGMVERSGSKEILKSAGYDEIASHYETLDKGAILIDAVLGAAFPFGARLLKGKPTTAEVDIAQKGNTEIQKQTGGIELHATSESLDAHLQGQGMAAQQLLAEGKSVSELNMPKMETESVPNPQVADATVIAIKAFEEQIAENLDFMGKDLNAITTELDIVGKALNPDVIEVKKTYDVSVKAGEATAKAEATPEQKPKELRPEDFTNQKARSLVEAMPEAKVTDENGITMTAKELLRRAEEDFAMAEKESKLIDVAIQCAIGVGE